MNKVIINGLTLEEYATRLQEVLYYWSRPWEIPKKKVERKIQRIKRRKNERTNRNFY